VESENHFVNRSGWLRASVLGANDGILSTIYENRGLESELAREVAKQLTANNDLEAHARDELGINEISRAKPLQASFASEASFIVGGIFPLLLVFLHP